MYTASTLRDLYRTTIRHKYTWPGGYPTFGVMTDGGALCHACLKTERASIVRATLTPGDRSGWGLAGIDINYEDPDLYCDHCSDRIESAYAEEDAKDTQS